MLIILWVWVIKPELPKPLQLSAILWFQSVTVLPGQRCKDDSVKCTRLIPQLSCTAAAHRNHLALIKERKKRFVYLWCWHYSCSSGSWVGLELSSSILTCAEGRSTARPDKKRPRFFAGDIRAFRSCQVKVIDKSSCWRRRWQRSRP